MKVGSILMPVDDQKLICSCTTFWQVSIGNSKLLMAITLKTPFRCLRTTRAMRAAQWKRNRKKDGLITPILSNFATAKYANKICFCCLSEVLWKIVQRADFFCGQCADQRSIDRYAMCCEVENSPLSSERMHHGNPRMIRSRRFVTLRGLSNGGISIF